METRPARPPAVLRHCQIYLSSWTSRWMKCTALHRPGLGTPLPIPHSSLLYSNWIKPRQCAKARPPLLSCTLGFGVHLFMKGCWYIRLDYKTAEPRSPALSWSVACAPHTAAPHQAEVQCAVCGVQCAVCSVQCAVCSVQCAEFNVQCSVCSVQCAVCTPVCSVHCALGSVQCVVCSV
jgi:hypothetical protein